MSGEDNKLPGLFIDPNEALKELRDSYHYWTGHITKSSLELSVAVIAGNWAAFGSVSRLIESQWAIASIVFVGLALALNFVSALVLGELHLRRINYAEADPARWKKEFMETAGTNNPWPFTKWIQNIGSVSRQLRIWLPLFSAAFLVFAVLTPIWSPPLKKHCENPGMTIDRPFVDPDAELLRQKMNELIRALRK